MFRMMDFEVGKICRKFRIFNLDKDNLDQYPDEARTKLTTAIQCANAAEKTLNDFKEFLAVSLKVYDTIVSKHKFKFRIY